MITIAADITLGEILEPPYRHGAGGLAAIKVLACGLRALTFYTVRALSYDGVRHELVKHVLRQDRPVSMPLSRGVCNHPHQSRCHSAGCQYQWQQ